MFFVFLTYYDFFFGLQSRLGRISGNMSRDAKAVKFGGTFVALQADDTEANFTS